MTLSDIQRFLFGSHIFTLGVELFIQRLAAGEFNLPIDGNTNALQSAYAETLQTVGITDFVPNIPISYWTFRIMMTLGFIAMGVGAVALWLLRKDQLPKSSRVWNFAMLSVILGPLFANSAGWIFTEMGRQPWIVAGVLPTASAVSPGVSAGEVFATMVLYTVLYGILAVVEVGLILRTVKKGPFAEQEAREADASAEGEPAVA